MTSATMPPKFAASAMSARFLRRTVLSTAVTLVLVAMTATAYGYIRWAGWYLASGTWATVFLGLTPLILKAMLFERRPLIGLMLIFMKIAWLGLGLAAMIAWDSPDGGRAIGTALVAGVVTPIAVLALRGVTAARSDPQTKQSDAAETSKPEAES